SPTARCGMMVLLTGGHSWSSRRKSACSCEPSALHEESRSLEGSSATPRLSYASFLKVFRFPEQADSELRQHSLDKLWNEFPNWNDAKGRDASAKNLQPAGVLPDAFSNEPAISSWRESHPAVLLPSGNDQERDSSGSCFCETFLTLGKLQRSRA
ncbi:MAG: hypothetical protein RMJ19_00560, partial [Gemmatales bacterium]|nr:hypothetical protein [Gemmatales bacterium]MDW8174135.1 hypothetical protein [Gemmatales bacterium]